MKKSFKKVTTEKKKNKKKKNNEENQPTIVKISTENYVSTHSVMPKIGKNIRNNDKSLIEYFGVFFKYKA